jgi:hypothetical protein
MLATNTSTVAEFNETTRSGPDSRRGRYRAATALAIASVVLALAGCGGSSSSSSTTAGSSGPAPSPAIPVGVTPSQLHSIAASAGHPIYWAGTATGTYELTTIADGRTYIRYLPPGAHVGSSKTYLTIGTYVRPSPPYGAVRSAGVAKHATIKLLKGGGLAVQYPARQRSVYLVFPGVRYEVEVYDPSAATAFRLATTGKIVPVP